MLRSSGSRRYRSHEIGYADAERENQYTRTEGVWLISFKKSSGKPRVAYDEAVEEAARLAEENIRANQWCRPT